LPGYCAATDPNPDIEKVQQRSSGDQQCPPGGERFIQTRGVMRIALVLSPFDASSGEMLSAARIADQHGVGGVWTFDHFSGIVAGANWSRDPFVTLGAIAATTKRVRVGVLVANIANRPPAQLASALNTLQSMAPGRVVAGCRSLTG
jgi:alkanesulfonate monooxygenase SsuD/methylene tetrahydromethanopterin reductase-like flavin-dependent oxidoreductase (luciferase family)